MKNLIKRIFCSKLLKLENQLVRQKRQNELRGELIRKYRRRFGSLPESDFPIGG